MKNWFKSLMFVAVAAMTFTACTETNDEVNAVAKKTIITGVALLGDDTRSGFVGSETTENEDGTTTTVYKSAWDGTETIKLFADNGLETTATIDAEGKFTAEFEGELSENFFMTVCSPAEAWVSSYTCNIPEEQTPLAETVDPAAHIVRAQNVYVSGGTADYFKMQHQVGYGKMTVNTPEEFVIDHVDIELNGDWYGYAKNLSYTINADNVENNTFWFATDTIDVADFTVTAYDAEGNAYTKSVTIPEGRELSFSYGGVTKFSVSNLEVYEKPVAFTSAYTSNAYYTSDYVIMFEGPIGTLKTNPYGITTSNWELIPGTYNVQTSNPCFYNGSWTAFNGVNSTSGTISVSVVDGMYHFEFNIKLVDGTTFVETYTGLVEGLNVPDPRQALAMPEPTAVKTGDLTATLSWPEVKNAAGYKVACNCGIDMITTETSVDLTFPEYGTHYVFVTALAAEGDANYRNSETAMVELKITDPNNFADVMATDISWDSEGYFTLTTSEFSYFHLEVNSANRPNNNSLLPGDYTYGKNENQFRVKYNNRYAWGYGDSNGTMNVSFVDGEYIILINVTSGWGDAFKGTVGYKGMPDGWVAPDSGGNEGGETPEPELPANIALTTWNEGNCDPNAYRSSYIVSGDNISMKVWITTDHGANATSLGQTQDYTWVSASYVGNSNRFSTQNIVINGVEKDTASGTMNVVNNGDSTFNVTMNLSFTDGTSTTITYTGEIGTTSTEPENPGEGGGEEPDPTPGEGEGGGETPTPDLEPETSGTMKYIKNYDSEYTHLRYYEYTDGNDTIGVWFNSIKPDVTQLFDGTYSHVTNGVSGIVSNASTKVYVEKFDINGESVGGVQSSSTITVQESGKTIDFKIDYNSNGTILTKSYSFVGTITQ